jgi:hypothetical protein
MSNIINVTNRSINYSAAQDIARLTNRYKATRVLAEVVDIQLLQVKLREQHASLVSLRKLAMNQMAREGRIWPFSGVSVGNGQFYFQRYLLALKAWTKTRVQFYVSSLLFTDDGYRLTGQEVTAFHSVVERCIPGHVYHKPRSIPAFGDTPTMIVSARCTSKHVINTDPILWRPSFEKSPFLHVTNAAEIRNASRSVLIDELKRWDSLMHSQDLFSSSQGGDIDSCAVYIINNRFE